MPRRFYGFGLGSLDPRQVHIDPANLADRNLLHKYYHRLYYRLPAEIRQHRVYFSRQQRGFGENAFTAMWYVLLKEFRPRKLLEIGIYRGQVISLWGLLARQFGLDMEIHAVSPFSAVADPHSHYPSSVNYYDDTIHNLRHFGLDLPHFHRGLSTDPEIAAMIGTTCWDLAYIDGNHEYETAKADFAVCAAQMKTGGLIVLDDASLFTNFVPKKWSFKGHEGPSRLARELDSSKFEEILAVGHNRVFRRT